MSKKIPYEEIIDRIKDDVDYIADEAYTKGYTDGRKQAKTQAELDVAHDIENVAKENYQKGLDDAWECAKKIACLESDGGMPCQVLADIFDCEGGIIATYSASEAMERIKNYEEDKNKIRVGDEVKAWYGNAIVTRVDEKAKTANFFYKTGESGCDYLKNIERTGRHFDEIEAMMEKMRE